MREKARSPSRLDFRLEGNPDIFFQQMGGPPSSACRHFKGFGLICAAE